MLSWKIVALITSGNRVRHIVSSQDDAVARLLGRWSRPTENKEYIVMHNVHINIYMSQSPTFSLRTSILLLVSVILAPHRKYTMRQFGQRTPVAPLCEWIHCRAKRLICTLGSVEGTTLSGRRMIAMPIVLMLKVCSDIISRKSNSITLLSVTDAVPNSEYHLPIVNDYIGMYMGPWYHNYSGFLFILILPCDIILIVVMLYYFSCWINFFRCVVSKQIIWFLFQSTCLRFNV